MRSSRFRCRRDTTHPASRCNASAVRGGQHACLVAAELGMTTVFIHPFAGVLSAYGMGLADQAVLREQAVEAELTDDMSSLEELADTLAADATAALAAQGADPASVRAERRLHLRYAGTQAALEVALGQDVRGRVTAAHRARFGFATPERALVVEAVAVEAVAPGERVNEPGLAARERGEPEALATVAMWSGGVEHQAPVLRSGRPCWQATTWPARR